jgi:predicted phosphohydrolase
MKLRYFSDLHLEFIKTKDMERFLRRIPPGPDEVCILAGDIGKPRQPNYEIFMNFINSSFKKSFVILGNHEFYGSPIVETHDLMKSYFEKFHNITLLDNSCEVYEDHCFVGTTLWSHVSDPKFKINDVYSIPRFDYVQYNLLHRHCVDFLQEALNQENCIVITHHQPSRTLIHEKYLTPAMLPYNQWFASDLDKLILSKKDNIKAWFYGHTHTPSETKMAEIPFLCNPIGYPGENHGNDFGKMIQIE